MPVTHLLMELYGPKIEVKFIRLGDDTSTWPLWTTRGFYHYAKSKKIVDKVQAEFPGCHIGFKYVRDDKSADRRPIFRFKDPGVEANFIFLVSCGTFDI